MSENYGGSGGFAGNYSGPDPPFEAQAIREKLNRHLYFDNEVWYYLNACLARIEALEQERDTAWRHAQDADEAHREAVARAHRMEAALKRIAEHDGERWDYEAGDLVNRKPSPQDLARAALHPDTGRVKEQG